MSNFFIYGLVDPRNGQLRYVGKTERTPQIRLNSHYHYAVRHKRKPTHKDKWICQLAKQGLKPLAVVLWEGDDRDLLAQDEIFWIRYFRGMGCPLTNLTDGGEGCFGYKHTAEAKARMSAAKKGCLSAMKGKKHTKEARLLVSRAKTGLTEEQQRQIVDRYLTSGLSTHTVAREFGVTGICVSSLLKIAGEKPRNRSEARWKLKSKEVREEVVKRYLAGFSAEGVAEEFGVTGHTVVRIVEGAGIKTRSASEQCRLSRERAKLLGGFNDC